MNWKDAIKAEEDSWLIDDPIAKKEKIEREVARYPQLVKEMGLDRIDLSDKFVLDIGGGPVGISSILDCKERMVLDPLSAAYEKHFLCPYHKKGVGEAIPLPAGGVDVVIISNALDHTQEPRIVLWEARRVLRAGGWLAVHNCIWLKSIHPHEAHIHQLDSNWFHNIIDENFETVHELEFDFLTNSGLRYGWVKYGGKVGQPAWAGLYRKVIGYEKGGDS